MALCPRYVVILKKYTDLELIHSRLEKEKYQ